MIENVEQDVTWGREGPLIECFPWERSLIAVLMCGGTNWATNGSKDRAPTSPQDLLAPHILRSICNVKITKIITSAAANYAVVIDIHGSARIFGRSPALALAANTGGVIKEHAPLKITPASLGLPRGSKFVGGAAARTHVLLVDSTGGVWGCGNNIVGQIGLPTSEYGIQEFVRINTGWPKGTKIVQVSAGNTFSLFLTEGGEIYAAGSSESGQLGNGKTGQRIHKAGKSIYDIEYPPRLVQGLKEKKIVQIASGNQHSLALDEDGYVYAWGYAGYCRLGLQDQKDRLVPTLVPAFTDSRENKRAAKITCGPTNSVVIDRLGQYHMAGKWKVTGDGSTGQPYSYFKPIPDLYGYPVNQAASGGCTHFVISPRKDGGVSTIGFGQGCLYGELGLGEDKGKSTTKPILLESLENVDVIDVAAGSFFSLFLARPGPGLSDIPRHPEHVDSAQVCVECNIDRGEDDPPMECEKCDEPYHFQCLNPPLAAVPDGEWFCPQCEEEMAEELQEEENEYREQERAQQGENDGGDGVKVAGDVFGTSSRLKTRSKSRSQTPGKRKASEDREGPRKK